MENPVREEGRAVQGRLRELYRLAETAGISVEYYPMRAVESAAFAPGWIVMNAGLRECEEAQAVRLAHELGHCMTGSFYNLDSVAGYRGRQEARADRWAIERLVDRGELERLARGGYVEAWEAAEHFGVTEDFARKALAWYNEHK